MRNVKLLAALLAWVLPWCGGVFGAGVFDIDRLPQERWKAAASPAGMRPEVMGVFPSEFLEGAVSTAGSRVFFLRAALVLSFDGTPPNSADFFPQPDEYERFKPSSFHQKLVEIESPGGRRVRAVSTTVLADGTGKALSASGNTPTVARIVLVVLAPPAADKPSSPRREAWVMTAHFRGKASASQDLKDFDSMVTTLSPPPGGRDFSDADRFIPMTPSPSAPVREKPLTASPSGVGGPAPGESTEIPAAGAPKAPPPASAQAQRAPAPPPPAPPEEAAAAILGGIRSGGFKDKLMAAVRSQPDSVLSDVAAYTAGRPRGWVPDSQTEGVWRSTFQQAGEQERPLVLALFFSGAVGRASSRLMVDVLAAARREGMTLSNIPDEPADIVLAALKPGLRVPVQSEGDAAAFLKLRGRPIHGKVAEWLPGRGIPVLPLEEAAERLPNGIWKDRKSSSLGRLLEGVPGFEDYSAPVSSKRLPTQCAYLYEGLLRLLTPIQHRRPEEGYLMKDVGDLLELLRLKVSKKGDRPAAAPKSGNAKLD